MKKNYKNWLSYVQFLNRKKIPLLILVMVASLLSFMSMSSIELKTRIQDLLPAENPIVTSYNNISDRFNTSSILLTIEKGSVPEMEAAADSLVSIIQNDDQLRGDFRAIRTRMDRDFVIDKGLLLAEMDELEDYRSMTEEPYLLPFLTVLNDNLEASWLDEGGDDVRSPSDEQEILNSFNQLENFIIRLTSWILGENGNPESESEKIIDSLFVGDAYFFSPDYEMLLIQISPDFSIGDRKQLSRVISRTKDHIISMKELYPHLDFGISGDIAQEADEEEALGFDALYPALAALCAILILFYFSLSRLRSIFFTLIALAIGILFDLGLIGITLKELNMITSSFGALLVGLGIDFGIHIITKYGDSIELGATNVEAMALSLESTAPPVAIGGITTALAFFALCLSKTVGFVQFGFVAGSGIIFVLVSMFTILPLLLLTFDKYPQTKKSRMKIQYSFLSRWAVFLQGKAGPVILALAFLFTITTLLLIPSISYDYDMRRIGPQKTPSKATENRIMEAFELSPFPSFLAVSDLDEAREITEKIRKDRSVATVSSLTDYLPETQAQNGRLSFIKDWHSELKLSDFSEISNEEIFFFKDQVQRLEWNIVEIADISSMNLGDSNRIISKRDTMIREIAGKETGEAGREVFQKLISALDSPDALQRLNQLDRSFSRSLHKRIERMTAIDKPLVIKDLPQSIKDEMLSTDKGSYLISIYPTDKITTAEGMFHFDSEMLKIHKGITGTIPLSLALSKEILNETATAAIAVLIVIILFLMATFRSLGKTTMAIVNLIIGIIWMIGIYTLSGELNLINILAIPLIIGIGIDYNVHIIHSLDKERSIEDALASTGKSILLSALTTMIGFGSLALLGTFRGIATLGILLFLGTFAALVSSLTIIPLLVSFKQKRNRRKIMNKKNKKTTLIMMILLISTISVGAESAESIIAHVDRNQMSDSEISTLTMTVIDDLSDMNNKKTFRLESFSRTDTEHSELSVFFFREPRRLAGMSILTRDDGQWVYFPSTGRVRLLSGAAKGGSINGVGGDFSYEDLGSGNWGGKYSFTKLSENEEQWMLEGIPLAGETNYTRIVMNINRNDYIPRRIEFYKKETSVEKILTVFEVSLFSGRLSPSLIEMENPAKHSKTIIKIEEIVFDRSLNDSLFHPRQFYR